MELSALFVFISSSMYTNGHVNADHSHTNNPLSPDAIHPLHMQHTTKLSVDQNSLVLYYDPNPAWIVQEVRTHTLTHTHTYTHTNTHTRTHSHTHILLILRFFEQRAIFRCHVVSKVSWVYSNSDTTDTYSGSWATIPWVYL